MAERRLVKPMVESLPAGRQVRIFLYPLCECAGAGEPGLTVNQVLFAE